MKRLYSAAIVLLACSQSVYANPPVDDRLSEVGAVLVATAEIGWGIEPDADPGNRPDRGDETGAPEGTVAPAAPYPLDTCPISGGKLGSMGDPIVKVYDGREVRFCCAPCVPKFEANPGAAWKKIDAAIIKDQLPLYPLETCVVSGKPLTDNGEDVALNVVYANRLVRLCCAECEAKLRADPAGFISKIDKAAADAQRADYPLTTCVVSGGRLGSMGEPTETVLAGRLVRFCCANCEPKARANPAEFIAKIDQARAERQPQQGGNG